jgi:hypothetical protein
MFAFKPTPLNLFQRSFFNLKLRKVMKKLILVLVVFLSTQLVGSAQVSTPIKLMEHDTIMTTDIIILRGERYSLEWPEKTRPYRKANFSYILPDGSWSREMPQKREGVEVRVVLTTDVIYKDGYILADSVGYFGFAEYELPKSKKPKRVKLYIYKAEASEVENLDELLN